MKKRFFFSFLIFTIISLAVTAQKAEAGSAVQLTPTSLEFEISPGETYINKEFRIFNPSHTESQIMEPEIMDFFVENETGSYIFMPEPHESFSLSRWVTISPQKVTLEPLEIQLLTLTITAPEDAEPGGHYAILLTSAIPTNRPEEPEGVAVGAVGGVGGPLLATVPGEISWEGKILEFGPIPFRNLGPTTFRVRFQNLGTVHYKPYGKIEIFDFLDNKIDEVEIPPTRVFPQTIRRLETTWERLLLIGKYRAKATIYYGEEGKEKTDTAEIEFWGFPYKGAIVLLLTLGLVIVVSKLRKKEAKNRTASKIPSP